MLVWVLMSHQTDDGGSSVVGVFSSKELASLHQQFYEKRVELDEDNFTFFTLNCYELDEAPE